MGFLVIYCLLIALFGDILLFRARLIWLLYHCYLFVFDFVIFIIHIIIIIIIIIMI